MSELRIDTLEKYFKPLIASEKLSNVLLWASIILSFTLLYVGDSKTLKSSINLIFIVVTLLYFLITNSSSLYFSRIAQNKRMTNLISNSFGVPLDDEKTELYYNNSHDPSVTKLGINVFENSLFSKAITSKMVIRERYKILVLVVLATILVINRNTSLDFLAIIAQTLLTTTIFTNWIKLEILNHGFEDVYESCRKLFLNGSSNNDLYTSQVLDVVMKYEILKASMGMNLSTSIFHKINTKKTAEWERIKLKLGL